MPSAPPKPCRQPGCPALVHSAYCETHRRELRRDESRRRPSTTTQGYGAAWRKIRDAVLRDEPLCRACRRSGRTVLATDVDHIVPRRAGGSDKRSNLQPLCGTCHSAKTAREDGGFGNARTTGQGGSKCLDPSTR